MHRTRALAALALLAASALFAAGCGENTTEVEESVQSAEDNALVENEFASIFEIVDNEATENSVFGTGSAPNALAPPCLTRTVDTANRTLTLNFGSANCLCNDGRERRGTVTAVFEGKYKEAGSSVRITLGEDYAMNDMRVGGRTTATRNGPADFTLTVGGASITTPTGTILWSANRTVVRTEGDGTATPWDDVYRYTGSAYGTNRNGETFTVLIDEPLVKRMQSGCLANFVDGTLTLKGLSISTMTLDYDPVGGAACDRIAAVTINGSTRRIALR